MTILLRDRGDVIDEYLQHMRHIYSTKLQMSPTVEGAYVKSLSAEPISSLFADSVDCKVIGFANMQDPFNVEVQTEISNIKWNEPTQVIIQECINKGLPLHELGRSGGVYQSFCANKKLQKLDKFKNAIIHDSPAIYRLPWWEEEGKRDYLALYDFMEKRTYENIDTLMNNPELLVVGKPGTVGTGWPAPFNTRQAMAARFPERASSIRDAVAEFYADMKTAIENWPNQGATIRISGEFKGVRGTRSDVDVKEWTGDLLTSQILSSMTREVGNTPGSVVHGKGLNSAKWRLENIITRFSDEYTTFAENQHDQAHYLTTPPVTMPGEPDDLCLISPDFGYVNKKPIWNTRSNSLELVNPEISLPADMTILSGIEVRYDNGRNRQLQKISGEENTMDQYRIIAERPFAVKAREMQLKPKSDYMKVGTGDDIQMIIVRDAVPEFVGSILGNYLKLKGMRIIGKWHICFILGKMCCWNSEDLSKCIWLTVPRALRSVTSAKATEDKDLPSELEIGVPFSLTVDPEVRKQVMEYFGMYPELVYFEGSPDDYFKILKDKYWAGTYAQAKLGISSWLLEVYDESDIAEFASMPGTIKIKVAATQATEKMSSEVSEAMKEETSENISEEKSDESLQGHETNPAGGNTTLSNVVIIGRTEGIYEQLKELGLNVIDLKGKSKQEVVEWITRHTLDEGLIAVDGDVTKSESNMPIIYLMGGKDISSETGEVVTSINEEDYDYILDIPVVFKDLVEKITEIQRGQL